MTKSKNLYDARLKIPAEFRERCQAEKKSYKDFFIKVWNFYLEVVFFVEREEEQSLISEALEFTGVSEEEFTRQARLDYAQKILNKKKKTMTGHKFVKEANERLSSVVKAIMHHNDEAKEWWEKIYITPYTMKEYILAHRDKLGFKVLNSNVVSRLEARHGEELRAHYEKHDIAPDHNKRAMHHMKTMA